MLSPLRKLNYSLIRRFACAGLLLLHVQPFFSIVSKLLVDPQPATLGKLLLLLLVATFCVLGCRKSFLPPAMLRRGWVTMLILAMWVHGDVLKPSKAECITLETAFSWISIVMAVVSITATAGRSERITKKPYYPRGTDFSVTPLSLFRGQLLVLPRPPPCCG